LITIINRAVIAHSKKAVNRIVRDPCAPAYHPLNDVNFTSPPPIDRLIKNGIPVKSNAIAMPPAISIQSHLSRSQFPECSVIFVTVFPIIGKNILKLIVFGILLSRKSNPAASRMTSKNKTS
jgi:hypothetical protein